jgi:endonuclease YncB( thermonuclease family)
MGDVAESLVAVIRLVPCFRSARSASGFSVTSPRRSDSMAPVFAPGIPVSGQPMHVYGSSLFSRLRRLVFALCALAILSPLAMAMACEAPVIGEGRVIRVSDARTFFLEDGREVRLLGIETPAKEEGRSALEAMISGRALILRGVSNPDRYGRLQAYAFEVGNAESIQTRMVAQGAALAATDAEPKANQKKGVSVCQEGLRVAEGAARAAKRGLWGSSTVIKNAEKPGDILSVIGQFALVEGRTISVRQAGGTVYLNFGRQWTRDFAVTISSRKMAAFEAAGFGVKALEQRRIRVRGWVERRGGPRIEVVSPEQLEFVGGT